MEKLIIYQTLNIIPIYLCGIILITIIIFGIFFYRIYEAFGITFKDKRNMVLKRRRIKEGEDLECVNFEIPKKISRWAIGYAISLFGTIIWGAFILGNLNNNLKTFVNTSKKNDEIHDAKFEGIDKCLHDSLNGVRLSDYYEIHINQIKDKYNKEQSKEYSLDKKLYGAYNIGRVSFGSISTLNMQK